MANYAPTFWLRNLLWGVLLTHGSIGLAAQSEGKWDLCPPAVGIPAPPEQSADNAEQTVRLTADEVEAESDTSSRFTGNVWVKRGSAELQADRASYDRPSDMLNLEGNVSYLTPQLYLQGEQAQFALGSNSGTLQGTRFYFREFHAFGTARDIDISDPEHTRLKGVVYSTCNPEKQDWRLKATTLTLDKASNTGEAFNVTLAFKGVPFFYFPYLNFPLEGRKSGFLAPVYGTSEVAGNDIRLPFYWNIAPNYDATITPRSIAARGNMVMSEGRYLFPSGRGLVSVDYHPEDKLYNGDSRLHSALQHNSNLGRWGVELVHNYTTDPDFLNDFYTSQLAASQTHLERRADLTYHGNHWQFLARTQNYQTLNGSEPYSRMPQLSLTADSQRRPGKPYVSLDSEAVHFAHTNGALPQGTRLDLTPAISLPLQGAAWFLTPRVALRHTQYSLENSATGDVRYSRNLAISSLDGGLFFERDTSLGETGLVQTLEPRLFYLHAPYADQDELPLFDTGYYDFSYSQLFRENRFSGADRVGDANQLTTSLTSRYLAAATGRELARVSLGQISYFTPRRVSLTPGEVDATNRSDIVAELAIKPIEHLEFTTTERWNPDTRQEDLLTSSLRYRPADDKVAALSYRYQRELDLRQTDLSAFWPLTRRWRFIGRWQYDLENHLSYDTVGGLEYQSCCWGFRLVGRGRYNTTTQTIDHSIYLTLELKGLTSIGNRLDAELERGILGFPIH